MSKILVVDDEFRIREIIKKYANFEGHKVTEAVDGMSAIEICNKETFDIITAFETIYFWPDINEAFKQVYRVLKVSGTFMICNESNGENSKEEKWTKIIQGMKIYNSEQVKKSLEGAGFTDIKIHKNKKGWLCVVCKKG